MRTKRCHSRPPPGRGSVSLTVGARARQRLVTALLGASLSLTLSCRAPAPDLPPLDAGAPGLPPGGDADGDGYANEIEERFGSDPTDAVSLPPDLDGDFLVDGLDPDQDGDGYDNALERQLGSDPASAASVPDDVDGDGEPDAIDVDDDGDGIFDTEDAFPRDATESTDTDGDGVGDNADPDDDGDGYSDVDEVAAGSDPLNPASKPADLDGDGIADLFDEDIDGDGVVNSADAFPRDAVEQQDSDGDGVGDHADADDDNDGAPDELELRAGSDPQDPASLPADADRDGIPDFQDTDRDGDGVVNDLDAFPDDPAEFADFDGDGIGDVADPDDDNDSWPDADELREGTDPRDPLFFPGDLDGDGLANGVDPDVDGDGVDNSLDAFPFDPGESTDTDGDGVGDATDPDDDNDGWSDAEEARLGSDPRSRASAPPDLDGDRITDAEDDDRDGDGFLNSADAFPDERGEWSDHDADGIGDNADPDDDNDGYSDALERAMGSDPRDASSRPADLDQDGLPDSLDPDIDGDGVPNGGDAFPYDADETHDTDQDGIGDHADPDDDGDGFSDVLEQSLGSDPRSAASTPPDLDGDLDPDENDPDIDGDKVPNASDAFPRERSEWADFDGDGVGDNADPDDDNDLYPDHVERTAGTDPNDAASFPLDLDGDRVPDAIDPDIDGDGYANLLDAFPREPAEWRDTDQDGLGDNADLDDDGDCYEDALELTLGFDPLEPSSSPGDADGDCVPDATDSDRDGDGVENPLDAFPDDPTRWEAELSTEGFGGGYLDLLPPDAAPAAYREDQFALVRGQVVDLAGAPMAGVLVNVVDHPEYGTAVSDAQGEWLLAVNGGGTSTFRFDDPFGSPSVDRNLSIAWNAIEVASTVEMTAPDPIVTVDVLDGRAGDAVVHQNEGFVAPVTVVIPKDVVAVGTRFDGSTELLREISVRATEYETPEGMPATLPPSSAFTLCVEFTVDGYDSVSFSQPVAVWVPNFLKFPVGWAVPHGVYDRDLAAWRPLPDGTIVRLLDLDGDTFVDAIDADGDGEADDLDGDGTFTSEIFGIETKEGFLPGREFWRLQTTSFSPHDPNYGTAQPPDAVPPPGLPDDGDEPANRPDRRPDDPNDDPNRAVCAATGSSRVSERARTLHQDIPLVTAPVTLHYNSEWAEGFRLPVEFTLSTANIPDSLSEIRARYGIAGLVEETVREARPNEVATLFWDGRDFRGQAVVGKTTAWAEVEFRYRAFYYGSPAAAVNAMQTFAAPGTQIVGTGSRDLVGLTRRLEFDVYRPTLWPRRVPTRLGSGWGVGGYYSYDVHTRQVIDASGARMQAASLGQVVTTRNREPLSGSPGATVADAEGNLFFLMTAPASERSAIYRMDAGSEVALLHHRADADIDDLALDPRGGLVFSTGALIRRLPPGASESRTVANLFFEYLACFGGLGDFCRLEVAVDINGYIRTLPRQLQSGASGSHLSLVSPDGQVVRFPLSLYCPVADLAVTPTSASLIACANGPLHQVDPDGSERVVPGYQGDCDALRGYTGGLGMSVAADASIYLADARCHRVTRIDPDAGSTHIVGTGEAGYSGDEGPLLSAQLRAPSSVALLPDGSLAVADTGNRALRAVERRSGVQEVPGGETWIALDPETVLVFDDRNLLRAVRDLDAGHELRRYEHDAEGRLVALVESDGQTTSFVHDAQDRVVEVVGPFGGRTRLDYDARGHLVAIVRADDTEFAFAYEPDGLMARKVTPDGDESRYVYDENGRIVETRRGGESTRFTRDLLPDDEGRRVRIQTGEGEKVIIEDDLPDGSRETTIRSPRGETLVSRTSADGMTTEYLGYDGTLVVEEYALDPRNRARYVARKTTTLPSGATREESDLRAWAPADGVYTREHFVNGVLQQSVRADAAAHVFVQQVPGEGSANIFFDADIARPVREEISGLSPTIFVYQPNGLLAEEQQGDRRFTYAHDARGFVRTVTRSDLPAATFEHDALGRLIRDVAPTGAESFYAYTAGSDEAPLGRIRTWTRPDGGEVHYAYDARERLTELIQTDGRTWTFSFDAEGRLLEVTRPGGERRQYLYEDGVQRGWVSPDAPHLRDTTILYEGAQPVRVISSTGVSRELAYDGTLLASVTVTGHPALAWSVTYGDDFRPQQMTLAGKTQDYRYDAEGLWAGLGEIDVLRDATHGRLRGYQGAGATWQWQENPYGEIDHYRVEVGSFVYDLTLTRNAGGVVTSSREEVSGASPRERQFTLDFQDRLVAVEEGGQSAESYTLDAVGRRVGAAHAALGWTAEVPWVYDAGDRLLSGPTGAYTYDAAGNRSRHASGSATTTYQHEDGVLLGVTLPAGEQVQYRYDERGYLFERAVDGEVTHRYLLDDAARLQVVTDGAGAVVERYGWGHFGPIWLEKGGVRYTLATDLLGSVRYVVAPDGSVAHAVTYDAWGQRLAVVAPGFEMALGYAGGVLDPDTGLVRFGERSYDPATGSFLEPDPIQYSGGPNLYLYADAAPHHLSDRLGLCACDGDIAHAAEPGPTIGERIAAGARAYRGRSTRAGPGGGTIACAYALNQVLRSQGIGAVGGSNPNWVPNVEADLRTRVRNGTAVAVPSGQARPGDIVVANNQSHVGVALGKGRVLSNSTSRRAFSWESGIHFDGYYGGGSSRVYRLLDPK